LPVRADPKTGTAVPAWAIAPDESGLAENFPDNTVSTIATFNTKMAEDSSN